MPKPFLTDDLAKLESDAIDTMIAGLKLWRSDLSYPESHSDMQACFRGLLTMYELKRRPLPVPLRLKCRTCGGIGEFISILDSCRNLKTCPDCKGYGWIEELRK